MYVLFCTLLSQSPNLEAGLSDQAPLDLHVENNDPEVVVLGTGAEASPRASREPPELEQDQEDEEQEAAPVRQRQVENEVSEVEIPNVGRIMVRADADGYNEEVSRYHHAFFIK